MMALACRWLSLHLLLWHFCSAQPPPRAYYMGFGTFPPKATAQSAIDNVNMWSARSDAYIYHTGMPWARLLSGMTPDAFLASEVIPPHNYILGRGVTTFYYMLDATNGIARGEEAEELLALNRSITESSIQDLYVSFALAVARVFQPSLFLGMQAETNLIRIANPTVYPSLVAMVNRAAAAIRQQYPSITLFVSVQVQTAWGQLPVGGYLGIEQDFVDFGDCCLRTILGVSNYPYLVPSYTANVDSMPLDYYTRLLNGRSISVAVVEGGWVSASSSVAPIVSSSLLLQADYVARHSLILDASPAISWFQLLFADIDVASWFPGNNTPSGLLPFLTLGLVDENSVPKPSLAVWDGIFNRTLRRTSTTPSSSFPTAYIIVGVVCVLCLVGVALLAIVMIRSRESRNDNEYVAMYLAQISMLVSQLNEQAERFGSSVRAFEQTRAKIQGYVFPDKIKLDVGGSLFSTSIASMTRLPESFFGELFSGRRDIKPSPDGSYFIDRNPKVFQHILDYLRGEPLDLASLSDEKRRLLARDAEFYQLPELLAKLGPLPAAVPKERSRASSNAVVDSAPPLYETPPPPPPRDKAPWCFAFTPNGLLSNDDCPLHHALKGGGGFCITQGTVGFSEGIVEFTVRLDTSSNVCAVGVSLEGIDQTMGNKNAQLASYLYCFNGMLIGMDGTKKPYFLDWPKGDMEGTLITVKLDCDAHTCAFALNGKWGPGNAFENLPAQVFYPYVHLGKVGTQVSLLH